MTTNESSIPVTVRAGEFKPIIEKLISLLPEVTQHLSDHNRLEEWTGFFT